MTVMVKFLRIDLSKYSFRLEKHEECDDGGDDSEASSQTDHDQSPSRIFVFLVSCVIDPKMWIINIDILRAKLMCLLTLQVNL